MRTALRRSILKLQVAFSLFLLFFALGSGSPALGKTRDSHSSHSLYTYSQDIDALGHEALPYFLPSRLECEILEYFFSLYTLPTFTDFTHFLFSHFTPLTPITRSTTSHSPHSLLMLLCYGAHLVFSSGTVSSRSTRRAEHAPSGALHGSCAEALWKLSSSTATQHAAETST